MKLVSLEKAFTEACDKHPHLKLLESQWRFDKELISKALQNISSVFPHYSRHDASHSKQIIVNIERLLGSKIKHLTATDMWLILEAAYTHDIGMVITHKQIQDMDTPEFTEFVKETAAQDDHSLNKFAVEWLNDKANLPIGSDAHSFFNKYLQLIAEWYRRKHPENSAKIIRDPYSEIGLDSPRNELLPNRLFITLADICKAHGETFEEVLKLPFSETGMATEDCHPRYVAFLLRMGDLLDIDDNRFCPVMMRMNGQTLPSESHAHFEKHRSIKHFRLDPERIEVKVVCPSPESYEQAHQWFKWLEDEHYKQSQHWHKIAPSKKLGRLPTLSSPDVTIEKPFLTIEKGKKPHFKVDESATLTLLRSTGLYSSKTESIREILQNAVDSTLIAIWMQHKYSIKELNPADETLHQIYDRYSIETNLIQDENDEDIFWLSVTDRGTGISFEELKFMLQVGSSSKNKKKAALKNEMPNWYRPSGNFGIGLQSIYLLSDSFSIKTKSRTTNEALEIIFTSKESPQVIIKKLEPEATSYGATFKVKIHIEAIPQSVRIPNGEYGNLLASKFCNYDFTRKNSTLRGYQQVEILSAIHTFNKHSPVKINSNETSLNTKRNQMFFLHKQNILLSNIEFVQGHGHITALFRGQPFEGLPQGALHGLVSCTVDYYGHNAIDFISYNREKILSDAKEIATDELVNSVLDHIDNNFHKLSSENKSIAAVIHYLSSTDKDIKYNKDLLKYPIRIYENTTISLSNILKNIANGKINKIEITDNHPFEKEEPPKDPKTIALEGPTSASSLSLIKQLATKNGMYWQESDGYCSRSIACTWSKTDIQPVSNERIQRILLGTLGSPNVGNRMLFPAWGAYRNLALKIDIPWARKYYHRGENTEYLVFPCTFSNEKTPKIEADEIFLSWTYENRKNETITKEEFDKTYNDLIELLTKLQQSKQNSQTIIIKQPPQV